MLRDLKDLDYLMYRSIVSLYEKSYYDHAYLLYDLLYELDKIDLYVYIGEASEIESYVLIWHGPGHIGVHIWRYREYFKQIIEKIILKRIRAIIQLYNSQDLEDITDLLKKLGAEFRVEAYLDMFVNEELFKPYNPQKATRLEPEHHAEQFIELKKIQGEEVSRESAKEILRKQRCYGIFEETRLVSIACRYIALPEIWIIGNVFTHPEYRGRGYGKIVTSAITRDAVTSGATAYLHVDKKNTAAINIYRELGYVILRERPWIYVH